MPTSVTELLDYLESHPWLRRTTFPDGTFRARVDRGNGVVFEGDTLSYFTPAPVTFDKTGFTVQGVFGPFWFEYAEEPTK